MKRIILKYIRTALYVGLNLLIPSLIILSFVWAGQLSGNVKDITHLWTTQPIVSIYVPEYPQSELCAHGYFPLSIGSTVKAINSGPCGCAMNNAGWQSSNSTCPAFLENSNVCMSLRSLPKIKSRLWRGSTICVKRGSLEAAGLKRRTRYYSRPHPDRKGFCPAGYKKCGAGFNQQDGAICFPVDTGCPITNMMILPSNKLPRENEGWESSGHFHSTNTALYVRREYINELTIVDIVFQLTEGSIKSAYQRGRCYQGRQQRIRANIKHISSQRWSYNIDLPPPCEVSDPRYVLVDQVPLQDHFLQNLQLTEPACEGFALYPLSDPRYQTALDPDYLNSGVKCDFTSKYTCVRDPYLRTACAAGDDICDGVVNQNVCGEYAHAVRSAFSETTNNNVTLACLITIIVLHFSIVLYWIINAAYGNLFYSLVRCVSDSQGFAVLLVLTSALLVLLVVILQVESIYTAVDGDICTDAFTTLTLRQRLEPINKMLLLTTILLAAIFVLFLDALVEAVMLHQDNILVVTARTYHFVPKDTVLPYSQDSVFVTVKADYCCCIPILSRSAPIFVVRSRNLSPTPAMAEPAAAVTIATNAADADTKSSTATPNDEESGVAPLALGTLAHTILHTRTRSHRSTSTSLRYGVIPADVRIVNLPIPLAATDTYEPIPDWVDLPWE